MRLALVLTVVWSLAAYSRPVEVPTYEELHKRADLVVLVRVQEITETDAQTGEYGDPNFYQGCKAKCEVLSVLKGALKERTVFIPFFQHPEGLPGFNGAIPAPFSLDKSVVFLAYLKRNGQGRLTPVTGEYDAGLSIKMTFDFYPDPQHVKLPPHGKKAPQPGAAPNGSPLHR